MTSFLQRVSDSEGAIYPDRVISELHIAESALACVLGLQDVRSTPARLRDMVEIIDYASLWAGSTAKAFAWYRSQPLPSFGDRTPEDLVREGRSEAIKAYLERINVGGAA